MATSNSRGGGFTIGAVYGLIASGALYLVLVYLFPLNLIDTSVAPAVMVSPDTTIVDPNGGLSSEPQPLGSDEPVAGMEQPQIDENSAIAIGGAGDTGPEPVVATQIGDTTDVNEPEVATESAGVPDIGNGTPDTGVPVTEEVAPVTTNVVETVAEPVTPPAELAQTVSGPATEVFAVAFTGDTSLPKLAIIMQDTLEAPLQPLIETGAPLNFAIPADVDSRQVAQNVRENGFEVVAMMPSGLSRTEGVAENVAQFMQNVPVAVALLDANTSGLMLNRDSMNVILETTSAAGLGLITFAGSGDLLARDQAIRAGAHYGNIVQIIDRSEDVELIIQALDRAAFEAITRGSAIVYARAKPKTVEALVRWLEGAFARRLQIVPVSVAIQPIAN